MIHIWGPTFDDVFVYRLGDASYNVPAPYWAATQWYPRVAGNIFIPFLIVFLAFYEHLIHIPTEVTIWCRLSQRKRTKRGVMPLAILFIRYATLGFAIVAAYVTWNPRQTAERCTRVIWPIHCAFVTLVSMTTACVNAWRSRTITRAAIQSPAYYYLVQFICVIFLLCRLASLCTAAIFQRQIDNYLPLGIPIDGQVRESSCFSFSLAVVQTVKAFPENAGEISLHRSLYATLGLLIAIAVSDLAFALVTLTSIFLLSRNISTQTRMISSLFNNSIMFYSFLVVLDVAGVVYFVSTAETDIVGLITVVGSILTVRVLINEQDTILTASRHTQTHRWLTMTRDQPAPPPSPELDGEDAKRNGVAGIPALDGNRRTQRSPVLIRRLARLAEHDGCEACRRIGPVDLADGMAAQHAHTRHIERRGAGLTDIERVTVLEAGRSIDRPWPEWEDDVTSDPRQRDSVWRQRRMADERHGIQTLIREWWRDVQVQGADDVALSPHAGTHDGRLGTSDAGILDHDRGSRARRRLARLRPPPNDTALALLTRRSSRGPVVGAAGDDFLADEKDSIEIASSSASDAHDSALPRASADDTLSSGAAPPLLLSSSFPADGVQSRNAVRQLPLLRLGKVTSNEELPDRSTRTIA